MRRRSEPLLPLLATTVSVVVLGAVVVVFVPRLSAWFGDRQESVVGHPRSPTATVPVWVCRPEEGVALLLEPGRAERTSGRLDEALEGGPYHYLQLTVYNFDGPETFGFALPEAGFASPEGGANAVPAASLLRDDAAPHLRAVLNGLGAVARLEVARGHTGQALLVLPADPARRTGFLSGALRFERRELQRHVLASWRQRPDWDRFKNF